MIAPFSSGFNPIRALTDDQPENKVNCNTVNEAVGLFYSAKQHLPPATVDAYRGALDHLVDFNGLEKISPKTSGHTTYRILFSIVEYQLLHVITTFGTSGRGGSF